jgi:hypothetical protein
VIGNWFSIHTASFLRKRLAQVTPIPGYFAITELQEILERMGQMGALVVSAS